LSNKGKGVFSSPSRDERKFKARDKSEIASVQSPLNDLLVVASEPGFFVYGGKMWL
jgi:hypothetical protein